MYIGGMLWSVLGYEFCWGPCALRQRCFFSPHKKVSVRLLGLSFVCARSNKFFLNSRAGSAANLEAFVVWDQGDMGSFLLVWVEIFQVLTGNTRNQAVWLSVGILQTGTILLTAGLPLCYFRHHLNERSSVWIGLRFSYAARKVRNQPLLRISVEFLSRTNSTYQWKGVVRTLYIPNAKCY